MATTKLFYQQPIGGENVYGKAMNQCITQEDAYTTIAPVEDVNNSNGALWFNDPSKEDNRYLLFTDLGSCSYKVQLTPLGSATFWVAGQSASIVRKIYNPFNYKLNSAVIGASFVFTSIPPSFDFTIPATSNIAANSSTTNTTINITVPSPEIIWGTDLANVPTIVFNGQGGTNGTLISSGNTDLGKNLEAMPVPYYDTSGPLGRPILMRPYVEMTRSGSGNVNSGATVTLTCKVYNRNDGKTSASGGTYSLQKVKVRLTLSGSGFSGNAGTIAWGGSSSTSYVEATGITISRTTNQSSPSYATVTFTYTAPSTTTQGTVTITPSVTDWYYGSNYGFSSYPGTGNTVQITVNAAGPVTYYFPFRITIDGKSYMTRSEFEAYASDLSTLYMRLDYKADVDIPYSNWQILSGYNTIWYVSTTQYSVVSALEAYGHSDCDEIAFNDLSETYNMPTTVSYSAFNSAGINDGWANNSICVAVGCGYDCEIYFDWDGVIMSFTATPEGADAMPLNTLRKLQHLYFKIQLTYQNGSYNSGKSRVRTLVYDFSKRVYNGKDQQWENGVINGTYSGEYMSCSTGPTAISDTWNFYNLTDVDFMYGNGSSSYGAAYISYIGISSDNSVYYDLSLENDCQTLYNRCWGIGEFVSIYDTFNNDNAGSRYNYTWNQLCGSLVNVCGADIVVASDEMVCNVCGTLF